MWVSNYKRGVAQIGNQRNLYDNIYNNGAILQQILEQIGHSFNE